MQGFFKKTNKSLPPGLLERAWVGPWGTSLWPPKQGSRGSGEGLELGQEQWEGPAGVREPCAILEQLKSTWPPKAQTHSGLPVLPCDSREGSTRICSWEKVHRLHLNLCAHSLVCWFKSNVPCVCTTSRVNHRVDGGENHGINGGVSGGVIGRVNGRVNRGVKGRVSGRLHPHHSSGGAGRAS